MSGHFGDSRLRHLAELVDNYSTEEKKHEQEDERAQKMQEHFEI